MPMAPFGCGKPFFRLHTVATSDNPSNLPKVWAAIADLTNSFFLENVPLHTSTVQNR